jgi:hypothetical protein
MLVPAWLRLSQSSVNPLHVALRPYIPVRVNLEAVVFPKVLAIFALVRCDVGGSAAGMTLCRLFGGGAGCRR